MRKLTAIQGQVERIWAIVPNSRMCRFKLDANPEIGKRRPTPPWEMLSALPKVSFGIELLKAHVH